jgi:plasmid stabilization system protein ParE
MSPRARTWYLAEIAYLAERNPAAAEKVVVRMRAARELLATHPGAGAPDLIPGTRRLVIAPYVLTIRLRSGVVEIVAIRPARQRDAYAPADAAPGAEAGEL